MSTPKDSEADNVRANVFVRFAGYVFVRAVWITLRILFRFQVRGVHHIPRTGPVLLVSNHPSYLEPVLFVGMSQMLVKRRLAFMAWDKLFKIPLIGAVMRFYGAFPVDLANPGRKPYETLLRTLRAGGMAGIFPEGGRSETGVMGPWKPGALRAALSTDPTIIPVSVIGADRAWPVNAKLPRFFRRVTLHIHEGRKLDTMGGGPAPSGSAKDWLRDIEDHLRDEINAVILDAQGGSLESQLAYYAQANRSQNASTTSESLAKNSSNTTE